MGNGESSPRSYAQQIRFSDGYADRDKFNRESSTTSNYTVNRNYDTSSSTSIPDNFSSLEEVTSVLRDYGLESSNLILGIDFTKSNEWMGKHSFNRRSLHAVGRVPNPYEQAISIIGRTLSAFDEDNLIPCFGFGDATTHDKSVFSFYPDHHACQGFEEVLSRYREILPFIKLSGPTSFAPLIHASISIVERSNWQYHVLVIIADGQVTRSQDTPPGTFSPQEKATIDAIMTASSYPLSIIMIGVGDGPWDMMEKFDDLIPQRSFDNFQFVNFTKIMSTNMDAAKKEAAFALAALMEVPFQYKASQSLRRFKSERVIDAMPLPPPPEVIRHDEMKLESQTIPVYPPTSHSSPAVQICPICLYNPKDMAFGCGHLTCKDCAQALSTCPICRTPIVTRIRLYSS
ncbi:copine (Calcium-dependent phospholipid-binding protein) family [Wolffia australiana]